MAVEDKKRSTPKSVFICLGMLGFTVGSFTGMSESPVGAVIVGALFGLLGGGGIFALFGRPQEKRPSPERLSEMSWGLFTLCLSCLFAVFIGISLREGYLTTVDDVESAKDTLIDLHLSEDISRQKLMKLVILQSELQTLGVHNKQNNLLIGSFLKASRIDEKGISPDRVGEILGYAKDIAGWNRNVLYNLLSNTGKKIEDQRVVIDWILGRTKLTD